MQNESAPGPVLVILTSHQDKEHMTRGFVAGADDYIPKSVDTSILKARVRALLRRKFLVDENRHILNELKEKELRALRAKAEKESAELRALVADQLADSNRELEGANRKLDLANRELEHFAFAAAHDLQEPLRMIGIYSQLLQRRYRDMLDANGAQYVDYCVEGAQRMDRLIHDLLEYARATQGGDPAVEPVDCNVVLEKALANLHGAIEESGAKIVRGHLPSLCIEEIRMQQLLQNLVGNAIKYRRPGEVPRVRIAAQQRDKEWLFLVEDNGIGIEPEQQQTVFGAFKRLHKGGYTGTGLGLAICQRIVEHYGGRIWVESASNGGSVFYFTFPSRLEAPAKVAGACNPFH
jgi:light-regulated signal transduction histidine kinase (bacteriophytochrome)